MFELYKNIYAEKIETGCYHIFTGDEQVQVYIKINALINYKDIARLLRNISRQMHVFHGHSDLKRL